MKIVSVSSRVIERHNKAVTPQQKLAKSLGIFLTLSSICGWSLEYILQEFDRMESMMGYNKLVD